MSSSSSSSKEQQQQELVDQIAELLGDIALSLQAIARRHGDQTMCDARWKLEQRPPTAAEIEEAIRRIRTGA